MRYLTKRRVDPDGDWDDCDRFYDVMLMKEALEGLPSQDVSFQEYLIGFEEGDYNEL